MFRLKVKATASDRAAQAPIAATRHLRASRKRSGDQRAHRHVSQWGRAACPRQSVKT